MDVDPRLSGSDPAACGSFLLEARESLPERLAASLAAHVHVTVT